VIIPRRTGTDRQTGPAVAALTEYNERPCIIHRVLEDRRVVGDGGRSGAHRTFNLRRDTWSIMMRGSRDLGHSECRGSRNQDHVHQSFSQPCGVRGIERTGADGLVGRMR
jgi:hypothetical protein